MINNQRVNHYFSMFGILWVPSFIADFPDFPLYSPNFPTIIYHVWMSLASMKRQHLEDTAIPSSVPALDPELMTEE